MRYMGSKRLLAKHILPWIEAERKPGQWYVEPFVGGANMLEHVPGPRIGADSNAYLIALWQALQSGWTPPDHVTKAEYDALRASPDVNPVLAAWAGFCCSFGAKWFGGWVSDNLENSSYKAGGRRYENYQQAAKRGAAKQLEKLKNVLFVCAPYYALELPPRSYIYCDPPYKGTTAYKNAFDSDAFYQWVREKSGEGHTVIFSEYSAPPDFLQLWERPHKTNLDKNGEARTERLFTYI